MSTAGGCPIALRRPTQVLGQDMQVLRIHLNRGDKALAEPGAMVYMSENVEAGCDSDKWWPRCMGCEPCCFATFEAKGDGAYVGLTPNRPAKVLPLVLGGRRFLGKKGMYFASTGQVDVDFNMDLNPVTCCCGGLCGNQPVRRVRPSSGEEPASLRHRAGVASMTWRTTRWFSTNAP